MVTTARTRRPRFRVVSHSLTGTPRRQLAWTFNNGRLNGVTNVAVEIWTEAEWAALHPAERPDKASFLPGFGWFVMTVCSAEEATAIANELYYQQAYRSPPGS